MPEQQTPTNEEQKSFKDLVVEHLDGIDNKVTLRCVEPYIESDDPKQQLKALALIGVLQKTSTDDAEDISTNVSPIGSQRRDVRDQLPVEYQDDPELINYVHALEMGEADIKAKFKNNC